MRNSAGLFGAVAFLAVACAGLLVAPPSVGEESPAADAPAGHFESVRKAVLQRPMSQDEKKRLGSLFDSYAKRAKEVGGKLAGAPRAPGHDPELTGALASLVAETGSYAAAAVILDSKRDDYARQAALRGLMQYKNHDMDDLLVLAKIMTLPMKEEGLAGNKRSRIGRYAVRLRLAAHIGVILGIPWNAAHAKDGPTSGRNAIQRPDVWLRAMLQQAMALPRNKARQKLLGGCLVTLSSTQ